MNGQDLKNSILQLAIQGKLVEQREEEGTAKELLEKIKAEKEKLIKEKKIKKQKKQKKLSEITADEIPFDIPESWEWVRLGNIVSILGDGIHGTPNYDEIGEYYFVNGNNLSDGEIEIKDNTKKVNSNEYIKYKKELNENTVLVSINGTIGNVAFFNNEKIVLGKSACYFNLMLEELKFYLYWIIKTQYFLSYAINTATGTTIKNVSLSTMKFFLIPLPPLEEQKRIVAKIEELMPYVEKYDKANTEVEALNKKFPEDMQKSILQYAIQGKLVEQREEEGTAEELSQQIQEEKARLIKEGKLKKPKKLPEITKDEIPFEIPENWKWVRLGELVSFYGGYAYKSSTYVNDSNYMIIRLGNVKNDKLLLDVNPVFIPQDVADTTSKYKILPDDILFTMTGTRKKRDYFYTTLIDEENLKQFELFLNQRVGCLRNDCKRVNMCWLSLALKSEAVLLQIFSFETGTANQGNIGAVNTMGLMIPLPPLAEQKRIVAKIEELLPYTKQLVK